MLKVFNPQCSTRITASTSSSSFHTSAILAASYKRRKAQAAERENLRQRAERLRIAERTRPHFVLGHRPGDANKWLNSDLAKVIVTENDAAKRTIETLPTGKVYMPEHFDYGIGEREMEIVFETLPQLTIKTLTESHNTNNSPEAMAKRHDDAVRRQAEKTYMMARVLSLKNANAQGIAYANRRKIIEAFSEPEKPNDTGRPEVQAALLTYQILKLWDHLKMFRKDLINRRSLTKLVHRRAKILKYLKRLDPERYDRALERMGLEPEAVEGEIVIQ